MNNKILNILIYIFVVETALQHLLSALFFQKKKAGYSGSEKNEERKK